jgi:hypothetical protein
MVFDGFCTTRPAATDELTAIHPCKRRNVCLFFAVSHLLGLLGLAEDHPPMFEQARG